MKSDFKVKGLHLDLRIQVMPLLALKALAKRCAEQGLNTLLIEWEASFPYEKNFIISNSYAYSPQEIKSFIQFCKGLGIQVIPLQQCFGHIEYILRHERYAHLRESHKDICQLCPSKKKESLQVFTEIFKEIVASHPSPYIHIGGDETYLLGHCPTCKARAEKEGESRLYVDYFKEIAKCVLRLGKRPILWADMLLKHPEDAGEMPSETIFMDWNYGWKVDHFGSINALRKKYPFEMWGAPAIRCHPDNHGTTDWNTHFQNIHDYIPYARKARYEGIVMTSWSTSGIYGYEWFQSKEITEIHPVRRVYPLSGFHILLDAYAQALKQETPLQLKAFMIEHGQKYFGLTAKTAKNIWTALTNEKPLNDKKRVQSAIQKARQSISLLAKIKAKRHADQIYHLQLMANLRLHSLLFVQIEEEIQKQGSKNKIPLYLRKLKSLSLKSSFLKKRFIQLNQNWMYPDELQKEIQYRFQQIDLLIARLSQRGKS